MHSPPALCRQRAEPVLGASAETELVQGHDKALLWGRYWATVAACLHNGLADDLTPRLSAGHSSSAQTSPQTVAHNQDNDVCVQDVMST